MIALFAASQAVACIDECFPLSQAIARGLHEGWLTEPVLLEEWSTCDGAGASEVRGVQTAAARTAASTERALQILIAARDVASDRGLDYALSPVEGAG